METVILILQDTLIQQQKQLQNAIDGKKRANEHNYPIYEKAITNLKSVIAELEKAIRLLEASDGKTSKDASALPIPDGFWFDDEHGTTVTVIGIVDKWCMVEDTEHDEPYALSLEYVVSIYEESKEGNVR